MLEEAEKIIIIGAGPTGIGAAYRLKELGYNNFVVLEKENQVGGLSASFKDNKGFTWDIGGHIQFSHYKYFDKVMERVLKKGNWLWHKRESWIWLKERFIPYPFQNNIRYLAYDDMLRCFEGLIPVNKKYSSGKKINNFKEWIFYVFGKGIAEEFMIPYNRKVWAYPLSQLSYKWISDRVSIVDWKKVLKNIIMKKDDISWGPNNTFKFPLRGGTGAIWKGVEKLVGEDKFELLAQVSRIDTKSKEVYIKNGRKIRYSIILNTAPLDKFTEMVDGFQEVLKKKAKRLKYSSVNIVGIGLKGKPKAELRKKCWMYFSESNNPFYRVTLFSNYSPNNVPDPSLYWSLMAEVSSSKYKHIKNDMVIKDTIEGMRNTGLIEKGADIVSTWNYKGIYGYPTPSLERDSILEKIIPSLEKLKLYSRGRFGGWKYEVGNQDHSFMQGIEWADRIVLDKKEKTYSL